MKIAFLSFYSGRVHRGAETYVHNLANGLTKLDHQVSVFQSGPALPQAMYSVFVVRGPTIKIFTQNTLREIDHKTQLIIPTNGGWQSLMCRVFAIKNRSQMMISGQSGPGRDDRINLWTFPEVFIGLSDYACKWAKKANPFVKRIVKIPNGVDLKQFNPDIKPMSLDLPKPIILCVAALSSAKRLDLAIQAVARLTRGSLILVGKGEDKERLESLGKKLLPGRFQIMSFPHHQMPALYKTADLFTYPTVPWESFGIAMLEAMATGLPVVAADDPIRREIVGNAGLFVDPTDTRAYAQTLEKALSEKWGSKPQDQAKKFAWETISQAYDSLISESVR